MSRRCRGGARPRPRGGELRNAGLAVAFAALTSATAAAAQIPASPCPANPNWSDQREMRLTVATINGRRVLLAEGVIDNGLLPRLRAALADESILEIRLRSPGGDAMIGNQAGRLIRASNVATYVPNGWACAGSCAFMFLGGVPRTVEPGGLLIMQMFTFTNNREAIRQQVARGEAAVTDLMSEIAIQSTRLASEDNSYLIQMGVSRALLTDIVYRQRGVDDGTEQPTRRCLTSAELLRYNVVTQSFPPTAPAR